MSQRYDRNFPTVSEDEFTLLRTKKVAVVGAGGLGGYVLEMLVRFGIGNITVIDGDAFDVTNLNRQILATESNLSQQKTAAAATRVGLINSEVKIRAIQDKLNDKNAIQMIKGSDLVFDAVDNVPARFAIQSACRELNIPFVHAAVGGWTAQVCVVFPNDNTLDRIYGGAPELDASLNTTSSFTPALAASVQVAEGIKVLVNKRRRGMELLYIDLLTNNFKILNMDER